jgi:hypothetical protein
MRSVTGAKPVQVHFVDGISQGSCETLPLIFLKEVMGLQRESP